MIYYDINIKTIMTVLLGTGLLSLLLTPLAIRLAPLLGAMDIPKDSRRMHNVILPRFGGLAIFVSSMAVIFIYCGMNPRIRIAMMGGALMYLLGALDDIYDLKAIVKFAGQLAIAVFMYYMGIRITFITNYFGSGKWMLGDAICFIITVLWIVGITNTINLTDGLDGLAAGISAIVSLSIAYVAYIHGAANGSGIVCIGLTAIAGACIGFLPFNFSPAKTFMGDSGALYLGFMLSVFSVISPLKRATVIATMVPVMALAIPILDTMLAIVRRTLSGKPIMQADKEHLHHKLVAAGYDHKRSVMMLYGITGIMGMASVLISRELYKDAVVLIIIAVTYIYVFATDPAHRKPDRDKKIRKNEGETGYITDITERTDGGGDNE